MIKYFKNVKEPTSYYIREHVMVGQGVITTIKQMVTALQLAKHQSPAFNLNLNFKKLVVL